MTGAGHNSGSDVQGIARDQLRAFVERIERLNEENKAINDDKRDVYGEAASMGFDKKVLKRVVAALGHGEDPSED
ncbi:hypothetical protein RvVAT039_02330 [Agrobacterium vitis]|nr:hypothetical protein RvVAT039_02330 [Agrobacterium vitis]